MNEKGEKFPNCEISFFRVYSSRFRDAKGAVTRDDVGHTQESYLNFKWS